MLCSNLMTMHAILRYNAIAQGIKTLKTFVEYKNHCFWSIYPKNTRRSVEYWANCGKIKIFQQFWFHWLCFFFFFLSHLLWTYICITKNGTNQLKWAHSIITFAFRGRGGPVKCEGMQIARENVISMRMFAYKSF